MAESKRIIISLPNSLLKEVDDIVQMEKKNRSEFIREAMKLYIREKRKIEIRETMKKGYTEMANINLALAESAFSADFRSLDLYEAKLSESE
ncbi:ribbon-helix-helix protein, CopG family [Irregularibacter muris]|uniref:Ribbon-helix-helix protein, CopG family n=1 Tax=Irregularibacter muris TaxID=1796619 RepID=A0AAE3KZ02_9FIRM|nr:ribbon-helix-helix protein, CopG family [Irregularibacter muris]MCR1898500.1 ribbon-helix-helix protein, CopG family [Irregularibacter muris]